MSEISLRVTSTELDHLREASAEQRQIALTSPSDDIAAEFRTITTKNRRVLIIGNCVPLILADSSAVWRAHNTDRLADFDALFDLLARRPDQEMRVICELRMPQLQ